MSGSHAAALKFCMARIPDRSTVVDVGAGMSPLSGWLSKEKACKVFAFDLDRERLTKGWEAASRSYKIEVADATKIDLPVGTFDVAVALYSLQGMLGYEALVWVRIHQWLKRGGAMLVASRYAQNSPIYHGDRGDPFFSQDEHTIRALAIYCGFEVVEIHPFWYDENTHRDEPLGSSVANAVLFQLRAL
jgi:2-polyprenyl-3-methyl-5-hydroxy-6-metoxy-1,4-benzoquinol methylase